MSKLKSVVGGDAGPRLEKSAGIVLTDHTCVNGCTITWKCSRELADARKSAVDISNRYPALGPVNPNDGYHA